MAIGIEKLIPNAETQREMDDVDAGVGIEYGPYDNVEEFMKDLQSELVNPSKIIQNPGYHPFNEWTDYPLKFP